MQIRKGDIGDVQNICELLIYTWQRCYKGFMPMAFLDNMNMERQVRRHTTYMSGRAKYFIAESEEGMLLGFASYGDNRMEGVDCDKELYTIYVDVNQQGKRVGAQLLETIFADLDAVDTRVGVSVFEQNPFKDFYIKSGFKKVAKEVIDLGEFELESDIYVR